LAVAGRASFDKWFSLQGRCALVTGASRGLGRAMAVALAQAGANVVCSSSRRGGCEAAAAAIRGLGRDAWEVHADLSDREATLAMADEAERLAGQIDILVNNAGTIRRRPALENSADDWDAVLRVNLDATFFLSQRFGAVMVERRAGKIVNVASLLSFRGGVHVPAYTASKHAVAGLTRALANEWGPFGVQVNAIAPGFFVTDNTASLRAGDGESEIRKRIPAGRWGRPEDVEGAVVFLASPASDYVTGHLLVVDGGWLGA
jgi:2-deoxy-D-gluconate 3-dehydrogenase